MPSLSDHTDRHIVIDRREDHYLAFPDIIRADDGRLVVAYNEADRHVRPTRRVLAVKTSADNGRTWSQVTYPDSPRSHSPRIQRLPDRTLLISDSSGIFHTSLDNGITWTPFPTTGLTHDMHDRIMVLGTELWLTTGHSHVGQEEHPAIRQPPTEQIVFRSMDQGHTWKPISTLAAHRNLVLCEASMTQLPDGRILALLRENSFVFEPMYLCVSHDNGLSWSNPVETPLIGHRPTMGQTSDGRLLVTYRNVGPDWGTCAWLGTPDQLISGFRVHGRAADPANPTFSPEGMHVRNTEGNLSVVRYALRPMTDPRTATACLEAEIRVDAAQTNGCGLRLGMWWRIYPGRIVPDTENAEAIPLEADRFNRIRLEYGDGQVRLCINGTERAVLTVPPDHAETRPILFGAPYPFEDNAVDCIWKRVTLTISEPAYSREYTWEWEARNGLPDQWVKDHILELRNDRHAAAPDFGYSGWTELEDGHFFCTYHHGGALEAGYQPLHSAFVAGTWFSPDDFNQG